MWVYAQHNACGVLVTIESLVPFSVPFRLYPFSPDPFIPFRSRSVHIRWIMICSYLLDHDTFVPLGSRHVRTSWITTWSLATRNLGSRCTLWSSYPLILATIGISYLLVTCILWYLTTFGNSWPLATRNLWRLVPFWSNLSAMVSNQRNQPWPHGLWRGNMVNYHVPYIYIYIYHIDIII